MKTTPKPNPVLSTSKSTKQLPLRTPKFQQIAKTTLHSRETSIISLSTSKLLRSPITSTLTKHKENSGIIQKTMKKSSSFRSIQTPQSLPLTPQQVVKTQKSNLTPWELTEILQYDQVFFYSKKQFKLRKNSNLNNGFDNEVNEYKANIGDHVAYRYEVVSLLGKGSFGQVFKVFDHKEKELQALKIIRNRPKFHKQGAIEVEILNNLKEVPENIENSVIRMKESFKFREHLCITFELLSINLFEHLKANNFKGLSLVFIQKIAQQLLDGLKLFKDLGIIHCDLKPENILLKHPKQMTVKIIDFGSSCYQGQQIYNYIQSRFYRAPEVILGLPYCTAIDMWSFGCILTELYTGFPLFPGKDEIDQLHSIIEVKGKLPDVLIEKVNKGKFVLDDFVNKGSQRLPGKKKLSEVLKGCDDEFVDLISKCLEWDIKDRLTPEEAMKHPWLYKN